MTNKLIESVIEIQSLMDKAGVLSMLVGGLAVAVWGEPRLTRDADLKILMNRELAQKLLNILGSDYIPLQANAVETIEQIGMLFVQNRRECRIDLLLAETSFDEAAIQRRRNVELLPGKLVSVCSPEDLIIYKLISTRGRDQDDARSVILRQAETLDDAYITHWLSEFETALDDSTLIENFRQIKVRKKTL